MNSIMAECSFTSTSYSPEKTSIVRNVRVQATRPTVEANGTVALGDARRQSIPTTMAVAAAALNLVLGLVLVI